MLVGFFSKTLNQEKDKWVEEKKKASPTYVFPGWNNFNVSDIKTSSTATVYAQLIPHGSLRRGFLTLSPTPRVHTSFLW